MSTTIGATLLAVSLTTGGTAGPIGEAALPRPVLEAGLKKAGCTVPPGQAQIVGTERLSDRLAIVEVACWRAAYNSGSILFAVPQHRPQRAQLLTVERWEGGRVRRSYSVASPGYDSKTRTMSSTLKARNAGDCGTIQEMKWTGWHFRLLNAWKKDRCDGETFEWDSRDQWQVFPTQARPRQGVDPDFDGTVFSGDRVRSSTR
jgi:hypothetical protein